MNYTENEKIRIEQNMTRVTKIENFLFLMLLSLLTGQLAYARVQRVW